MKNPVEIAVEVNALPRLVWECWTSPEHIVNWNFASDEWCAPSADNNLVVGGQFCYRMESKDGEIGFDLKGTYTGVQEFSKIAYKLEDERAVEVLFEAKGNHTIVKELFEAENQHDRALQQQGWQAILYNFKKYVEQLQ